MNTFKRYLTPLLSSAGFMAIALLAACGGGDQGRDPILGLPAATVVTLAVTPATASVPLGASQQFVATATLSDGSVQNVTAGASWSSASTAVATINAGSGAAASVAEGTAVISAGYGGKTAAATLTVLPPALVSMIVTPANPSVAVGATQQFTVAGTFTDHSTRDITADSAFVSATPAVASIGAASGLAAGLTVGSSRITATSGAINANTTLTVSGAALLSIAVTPQNPTIQINATRQLAVTASYDDGSTADVSNASAFVSATTAVATSSSAGLVSGVSGGTSVLTANFGGKVANTTVTVGSAVLSSISVTPASATVAINGSQQFIATANYSDSSTAIISNTVLWSSSSTAIGTVASSGLATGLVAGSSTITASAGGKSGTAVLTVSAVVTPPVVASLNLRSAASFAVLAGTSITNNSGGTTLVTGDVGGASQTVDPTQVAGYTNYKSGAILSGALADLQTAITDANGRSCDVSFAGGIDLGGQTFGPGVYCYAGAISITGTLTLNGPGVYIFRTALTLNSTANSIVALKNGATAANVNWLPVGPTTLGANSVFKGNILGQSAAITVGDNTTLLNGRVLTAAAVTLRNNQIAK